MVGSLVHRLEEAAIILGAISCFSSAMVILTYFMFADMRKKMFMKFIFYISFSDFMMNVTDLFGFPRGGSDLCWIQGTVQIYFALASFFWTTMLSFTLFSIISWGTVYLKMWKMHIFCWLFPLILTLAPLYSCVYTAPKIDTQWCLLVAKDGYPPSTAVLWSYLSFFGWMMLSIVLMSLWGLLAYTRMKQQDTEMSEAVKKCYDKVWLYPIAMTICWFMNFACTDIIDEGNNTTLLSGLSMMFGISYGLFTSLIFVMKSDEARKRWWNYLFPDCSRGPGLIQNAALVDFYEDDALTDFYGTNTNSLGGSVLSSNVRGTSGTRLSRFSDKTHTSKQTDDSKRLSRLSENSAFTIDENKSMESQDSGTVEKRDTVFGIAVSDMHDDNL